MLFTTADLAEIKKNIINMRIAVVGDYCLDNYYFVESKLDYNSDYTDLSTYCASIVKSAPGGAGNVAKNLSALGVSVYPIGLIGNDGAGFDLCNKIDKLGMDLTGLIKVDALTTNSYHRFIRDDTAINEVLVTSKKRIRDDLVKQLMQSCANIISQVDAVIIVEQFSDIQGESIIELIREYLQHLATNNRETIFIVDTKRNAHKYTNMYVKCNHYELQESTLDIIIEDKARSSDFDISQIKHCISILNTNSALFITVGKNGILFFHNGILRHIKTNAAIQPFDTCGAGDSATVGITIGILLGFEPAKAAILGNIVAGITIQQLNCTGEPDIDSLMTEITHHSSQVNTL